MQWARRFSLVGAVVTAFIFGASTQASAAEPPQNVGWLYTVSKSGAGFFDADLEGQPSDEKITVCDNRTDSRGIVINLKGTAPNGQDRVRTLSDPSNDGKCESMSGNFFADGYYVYVQVCEYSGGSQGDCSGAARGVA
jgi:hypothetical protein